MKMKHINFGILIVLIHLDPNPKCEADSAAMKVCFVDLIRFEKE